MKVLLVKPYNKSDHIQPSLGLGYLASSVRGDHDVEILDCIKDKKKALNFGDVLDAKRPDIVGIQCYTYDLYYIGDMLKECKKRNIKTILGGPHPSTEPLDTMEFFGDDVDYIFQGEAEVSFKMLLDGLDGKRKLNEEEIPGLGWKKNGKFILNEKSLIDDIDTLGFPAWDLIKPQTYPEAQHGAFFRKFPIAPIITTRGCPFSCTFCAGNLISGKKVRKRSAKSIIDEIKLLYDKFGIREFHIVDDNFTFDKNFAKEVLRSLKELKLDISWAVPNGIRMDTLDDEILELMKDTGLYLISLGIESGSDRILRLMKKNITTDEIKKYIKLIKKHKIDMAGFFILGFPGETREDIEKTIEFSRKLDLIRANFFTYLPLPGTESFNDLKSKGKLDTVNRKKFYFMNATFTPDGMDKATLKSLQRKAFMKFFLRPNILFRNLIQIKSFNHFKFLFQRFFRWIILK